MTPVNGKIIVRVNMKQKDFMQIGKVTLRTANLFATNYREKSPVIGEIIEGNTVIKSGQIAIFHHNHFYPPSPYFLQDDLYSVPFNKTVFGVLDNEGALRPMCGNILCDRVQVETMLPIPPELRKQHLDRVVVTDPGWTKYKVGQTLFTRPYSFYEIVYTWNNIEKRVHKIHEDMVVGCLKPST